jgi:hypothetical protein
LFVAALPEAPQSRQIQGVLAMFNLVSLFRSKPHRRRVAFDSSTAPSETIGVADGHSVIAYWFDDERLLFDAKRDWRFIGSLPKRATRATIVSVAEAYFRGFEQARGELRELGLSDEFFEMARQYEVVQADRPHNSD